MSKELKRAYSQNKILNFSIRGFGSIVVKKIYIIFVFLKDHSYEYRPKNPLR